MDIIKSLKSLAKYYFLYQSHDLTKEQIIQQQHNFLLYTIYANRDCAVGKYFQFDMITDYDSYRHYVPVMEYDGYKHWILQSVKGATDIIVTGKVDWFAKTSGTTSDSFKYIPVTK